MHLPSPQTLAFPEPVYFVSGIDTDVGKTAVTGWLAKRLMDEGRRVATLKFVQTGAKDASPDIALHRKLMGRDLDEDHSGVTAPQIFTYPASPHLAAELDGRTLDLQHIFSCADILKTKYDTVLVEGAGGLMVPLTRHLLTIDCVKNTLWPIVFVASGKLGSINHTLLSLEALANRRMKLAAFIWNDYCPVKDEVIHADTREYLKEFIRREWPETHWIECPTLPI